MARNGGWKSISFWLSKHRAHYGAVFWAVTTRILFLNGAA
jgi:hypothetical protein